MGGGVRWRIGRALGQGRSPDRIGPNCSETARPLASKNSPGLAAGSNTRLGWTLQHNELPDYPEVTAILRERKVVE